MENLPVVLGLVVEWKIDPWYSGKYLRGKLTGGIGQIFEWKKKNRLAVPQITLICWAHVGTIWMVHIYFVGPRFQSASAQRNFARVINVGPT